MKKDVIVLALLLAFLWPAPAGAVNPKEMLADPVLEARAREISKGLRCLVCQNQSIDDSDADLAKDLRIIVRQRLTAGDSDSAVVNFVDARSGDIVLLKPPFKGATLVLWLGPAAIGCFAMVAMVLFFRRRRTAGKPPPLSAEEKRRLEALLKDGPP